MRLVTLRTSYYQQFDADFCLDVPGEGYGGWQEAELQFDLSHTALVIMHAWDVGTYEMYPGWFRAVEYIPRAQEIQKHIFPGLLSTVRASDVHLFHVVGGGDYYKACPGYHRAVQLAGVDSLPEQIPSDPTLDALRRFRAEHSFSGAHNRADIARGTRQLDFAPEARPVGDEGVAENADQLFALCHSVGVNHLVYAGFAINWCLLMSPGGMVDMSRRGFMCSTLRQAVTAVENKETARLQLNKQLALWRVALAFGFVFDVDDFVHAMAPSHD